HHGCFRVRLACRRAIAVSSDIHGPMERRCVTPSGGIAEAPRQQPFLHQTPGVNRYRDALAGREHRLSDGFIGPHQIWFGAEVTNLWDHEVLCLFLRVNAFSMLLGWPLSPKRLCPRRASSAALGQGMSSRALSRKSTTSSVSLWAPLGPRFFGTSPWKPCAANWCCRS